MDVNGRKVKLSIWVRRSLAALVPYFHKLIAHIRIPLDKNVSVP
jgi:hypothetical protein